MDLRNKEPIQVSTPESSRPTTPVGNTPSKTGIPPRLFYGKSERTRSPPPLPSRPKLKPGSSHTKATFEELPPPTNPPGYDSTDIPGEYREPELITDGPDLLGETSNVGAYQGSLADQWGIQDWDQPPTSAWGSSGNEEWRATAGWETDWQNSIGCHVLLDGRDYEEERNWWNPEVRKQKGRPGPGILPPILSELIHDSEHTLCSVSVTPPPPPEIKSQTKPPLTGSAAASPSPSRSSFSYAAATSASPPPQSSAGSPHATSPPPQPTAGSSHAASAPPQSATAYSPIAYPPTADEVHHAIPHPNAYYCRKDNGWVIVTWKASTVFPPLSKAYQGPVDPPFPNQERRRGTNKCVNDDQPFDPLNHTHHFHVYKGAVDSHMLTPPYRRPSWETKSGAPSSTTSSPSGSLRGALNAKDKDVVMDGTADTEEGELLDLYICCQCSFYCSASKTIPGIIPASDLNMVVRDKMEHPPLGKTGPLAVTLALETIIQIIYNRLWTGETRLLRVTRTKFMTTLGMSEPILRIFNTLGFKMEKDENNETTLRPPHTDPMNLKGKDGKVDISKSQAKENRDKLLRAWVELSAWLSEHIHQYANKLNETVDGYKPKAISIKTSNEREYYQTAIGAHPKQIPRGNLPEGLGHIDDRHWSRLGLTASTYSPELLAFAYFAQCRCDPAGTIDYFSSLVHIAAEMQGACPQAIQTLIFEERNRNRFTFDDLASAVKLLGFGHDEPLRVEYDSDIEDKFIMNAWLDRLRRAWREPYTESVQKRLNEAFGMIAESRGSIELKDTWEKSSRKVLNPDQAYQILEVPNDIIEEMLVMVYSVRITEQPTQQSKWEEALMVIAESRDSERLRQLACTGIDPGEVSQVVRKDLPRGLNQLGNTCYLNSLLQYFYTIKDLRDAVIQLYNMDSKDLDDEKLTDEEIKRHRVGGRLITRREISRSRKFVLQLAELFFRLENSDDASVTPSLDLAKLALVTSRDEEEDETDKGGTDSSNDTDATLVDDGPSRFVHSEGTRVSPARSPGSILGKRSRDHSVEHDDMIVEDNSHPPNTVGGRGNNPCTPPNSSPILVFSSPPPKLIEATMPGGDNDVEMRDLSSSAPLPAPALTRKGTDSGYVMMFGRQHDVAECMDNCMFQIETALLKFGSGSMDGGQPDPEKTSIVKRLFYGKIRQRLASIEVDTKSQSSVHEKEDLFSHLPVNVTEDGQDIYDGLSGYFDDTVEYEGKKAKMEVSLVDLPPLLQIQLQRVQFNRETLQPFKSQAYIKFGETIYMDRFLDGVSAEKKARSKEIQTRLSGCRERLKLLTQGKGTPFSPSLSNTCEFLSRIGVPLPDLDDDLIADLSAEQQVVEDEISALRVSANALKEELELLWREDTQAAYELTSVFIHRGSSPSFGHYFFYSRHLPDHPDSWFKYNDSEVTVATKEEVLADTTGSTCNPYLLVFARKGSGIVDTVKRYDLGMDGMDGEPYRSA